MSRTVLSQAVELLEHHLTSDGQLSVHSKYLPGSTIGTCTKRYDFRVPYLFFARQAPAARQGPLCTASGLLAEGGSLSRALIRRPDPEHTYGDQHLWGSRSPSRHHTPAR